MEFKAAATMPPPPPQIVDPPPSKQYNLPPPSPSSLFFLAASRMNSWSDVSPLNHQADTGLLYVVVGELLSVFCHIYLVLCRVLNVRGTIAFGA